MFAGLAQAKAAADAKAGNQDAYRRYIAGRRAAGWTDADVDEYAAQIKVLMSDDDKAALDLYPQGMFASAADARSHAYEFWRAES